MKRITRLYLIRHGQIDGYENIPVYGHTDVDLTEVGLMQLKHVSERLRLVDIGAIYSSDLKRSKTSAALISRYHDVPFYNLRELREMYFGDWEGLTLKEIQRRFPEELKKRQEDLANYQIPGGAESIVHFSSRITACFEEILSKHKGSDIAIVVHGGVTRIILCSALGLDLANIFNIQQDYGCLNIIDYFPDSTLVRLVNG